MNKTRPTRTAVAGPLAPAPQDPQGELEVPVKVEDSEPDSLSDTSNAATEVPVPSAASGPTTAIAIDTETPPFEVSAVRVLRLAEGLYTLHISATGGETLRISEIILPMTHIGIPPVGNGPSVEIVAAYPGNGSWLGPEGGTVVLSSPGGGGHILVTSYVAAGQTAVALEIELRRLDRPELAAGPTAQAAVEPARAAPPVAREIPTEILLHIERAGDRLFPGRGWVGALGRKLRIEAFSVRPLERLSPGDVEFKAFELNDQETPWVAGGTLCGTRGRGLPLTGFAIRIASHLRERFDAVYEGSFFDSGITGPRRNGEPCRPSVANDPLEAINIRLIERGPPSEAASGVG